GFHCLVSPDRAELLDVLTVALGGRLLGDTCDGIAISRCGDWIYYCLRYECVYRGTAGDNTAATESGIVRHEPSGNDDGADENAGDFGR
ncbi:MAG: hypothetical protein ACYTEX_27675, partial [Planctomycetota bacterium]